MCVYVCIIGSKSHHARMYRLEIVNKFRNATLINVNKQSLINHFFIWLSH